MRDRAGLLLLYCGAAWKAEQITSQPRQPLHLSTSILILLTIFFFLLGGHDSLPSPRRRTSVVLVRIPRSRKSSAT